MTTTANASARISSAHVRRQLRHDTTVHGCFAMVSIGANLTGELLALTRPGVDPKKLRSSTGTPEDAADQAYKADGSSYGGGVTLTAVAGLHF